MVPLAPADGVAITPGECARALSTCANIIPARISSRRPAAISARRAKLAVRILLAGHFGMVSNPYCRASHRLADFSVRGLLLETIRKLTMSLSSFGESRFA